MKLRTLAVSLALLGSSCWFNALNAAEHSPNIGANAPKKLLWGDTHIHSGWSADASAFGNRLGPELPVARK